LRSYTQMSAIIDLPAPRTGALSNRLFGLTRRTEGLDPRLARVFVPWVLRHPRHIPAFVRLVRTHAQTKRIRARAMAAGVEVPPFLVLSVTARCNLRCAGCYASALGTVASAPPRPGLSLRDWSRVVDEAVSLGVAGFIIAGGEPFLLPGVATLFRDHPDRLFVVFTNGTALQPSDYRILSACPNTAVLVSLEGNRDLTDLRRGRGVFKNALNCLDRLREADVLTGISVTVGPANVDYWSQPRNIDALIAHSGPLAFFLEQIPAGRCEGPMLTPGERSRLRETIVDYRSRTTGGAYIIHSPDDEEELGGCVSAGRGFAHVNPDGDVTACPMSAVATHSVRTSTLREALASPLFAMIRANGHLLETEGHPCGLLAHATEFESMARGLGAYRTGASASEGRARVVAIR